MTLFGKRLALLFASLLALLSAHTARCDSVQLRVHQAAIGKLLISHLFTQDRKYFLGPASVCQFAFFENPVVEVGAEGLVVRAHFSGKQGTEVLGNCMGASDAFDVVARVSLRAVLGKLVVKVDRLERIGGSSLSDLLLAAARAMLPEESTLDPVPLLREALADTGSSVATVLDRASLSRVATEAGVVVLEGSIAVSIR